ncbi:hypothetical protein DRJ19_03315 [Candidatus Woesearchaeota archaeon]|nr:MAG: hypothetical protein DRJ19_03315 [Candidatus Woesearchaeota archaeon]
MELKRETNFVIYKYGDIFCCYSPLLEKKFYYLKHKNLDAVIKFIQKQTKAKIKVKNDSRICSIYIFVTYNCNFNCKYCFIKQQQKNKKKTLDSKSIPKIIKFLEMFEYANRFRIFIYGGEPFLHKDIVFQLIKEIKQSEKLKYAGITICTNGSIYSKQISEFLLKHDVYLSVSLDGDHLLNKERIDKNGNETFTYVANNIKRFQKDGVKVTISCTINKHNIEYLPQIPLIFKKELNIKSFGFNLPVGKTSLCVDFLSYQLFKTYEVCRKLSIYEDFIMKRLFPFLKGECFMKECNAYGNQIVIFPDLSVSTCIGNEKNTVKNLDKEAFEKLRLLWSKNITINMPECKTCVFRYVCGRGCALNSYIKTGSFFKIDKDHCKFTSNFVKFFVKKPINNKIKLVIMDYDGTIIVRDVEAALKAAAKELSPRNWEKVMELFRKHIKGFFDPKKLMYSIGSREKAERAIRRYFEIFDKGKLLKETVKLLQYLKEKYKRIVILSGNKKKHLIKELEKYGISNLFSEVYCFPPERKNAPESYLKVLRKEQVSPYEALYIGDSFTEIRIAESLGLRTALLKYGGKYFVEWIKFVV